MPEFGFPNAKPWNRSIGRTELFDPDYVPIVIFDGGDADFYTAANNKRSTTVGTMTFILKDNVFKFNVIIIIIIFFLKIFKDKYINIFKYF